MNILALIPARGGSKGVPKKNIKLLNKKPLIEYSIECAKKSNYINKILVSTDCEEILKIAQKCGAETPFLRPSKYALDTSKDEEFINHAINYLQKHEDYKVDLVVLLRPTTPIRDVSEVDNAIKKLLDNPTATGLRSSHKVQESPFKWFTLNGDYYQPISSEYSLEDANRPRQYFPDVFVPNGYVDVILPQQIKQNLYGDAILCYETPVSYEIDTVEDFNYIEYLMKKENL